MKKLVCALLAVLLLCGCGAPAAETVPETENGLRLQIQEQEVKFEPWEQDGLPMEGSYYLTKDVVLEAPITIQGTLKLHLNGHTVSGVEGNIYGSVINVAAGGELVIGDMEGGAGRLVCPRSFSANVTVSSFIRVAGTMTMAGGTVDAANISLEDVANGAGFHVENGGVLNVTGGTVIGGTTWCSGLKAPIPQEDTAGTAPGETQPAETVPAETVPQATQPVEEVPYEPLGKGGSIYVAEGGSCHISGGEIRDGSAGLGGNLYAEQGGAITITGGVVADGEAVFHGGNVYIKGLLEMSGGQLLRGSSYSNGGNLFLVGSLEMTGGEIAEGVCDPNSMGGKRGGNICVNGEEAVVHISNAVIRDGTATGGEGFGGNISVIGWCAREFEIRDSTISGGMGHRAGNLYIGTLKKGILEENLDYKLVNVQVLDGTSSYRGSNICLDSDLKDVTIVLNMENCDLIDSSNSTRDNLAIGAGAADYTWCQVTMVGGSIQGGTLTICGYASLTTYGTKLDQETTGYSGELIIDPDKAETDATVAPTE